MFRKNQEERRNARKMNGSALETAKRLVRATRNEIAADMLAFTAAMGSAAILHNSVCGIINDAAKGYYDKAGVDLVVKKHRWSTPKHINSKELGRQKVYSAQAQGWWFDRTTCRKMTDAVAAASAVCGAVAGGATRGIVKDALSKETWDSEESWDSYYEEEETAE